MTHERITAQKNYTVFRNTALDETKEEIVNSGAKGAAVYGFDAANAHATEFVYVQLFDADADDVTVGTTAPTFTFTIPPNSAVQFEFLQPLKFGTALTWAATTARTTNGAPTTPLSIDLWYGT